MAYSHIYCKYLLYHHTLGPTPVAKDSKLSFFFHQGVAFPHFPGLIEVGHPCYSRNPWLPMTSGLFLGHEAVWMLPWMSNKKIEHPLHPQALHQKNYQMLVNLNKIQVFPCWQSIMKLSMLKFLYVAGHEMPKTL